MDVLVCDDGNDEITRDLLARNFPGVVWRRGPQMGPGANRNFGASFSKADWLVFVDDDCVPRPGFIEAYFRALMVLPPTTQIIYEGKTFAVPEKHSLYWEAPHNKTGSSLLISCNFAIPRKLFLEVGGFDERYRYSSFEDTEFSARLQAMGVPMGFIADAVVDHPVRRLQHSSVRGRKWESRVISSFDFGATAGQVAWFLPRHAALVTLSRFRGQSFCWENFLAAWIYFVEFLYFVIHLPFWICRHRRSRSPFWAARDNQKHLPPRFGL